LPARAADADFTSGDENQTSKCDDQEGDGGKAVELLERSVHVFTDVANEEGEADEDDTCGRQEAQK
jgi:hypothetical protein